MSQIIHSKDTRARVIDNIVKPAHRELKKNIAGLEKVFLSVKLKKTKQKLDLGI